MYTDVFLLQTPCFWPSKCGEPENTEYGTFVALTQARLNSLRMFIIVPSIIALVVNFPQRRI